MLVDTRDRSSDHDDDYDDNNNKSTFSPTPSDYSPTRLLSPGRSTPFLPPRLDLGDTGDRLVYCRRLTCIPAPPSPHDCWRLSHSRLPTAKAVSARPPTTPTFVAAATSGPSGAASTMAAFVRVSGPPNSNFLVGYPGISATLVSSSCPVSLLASLPFSWPPGSLH